MTTPEDVERAMTEREVEALIEALERAGAFGVMYERTKGGGFRLSLKAEDARRLAQKAGVEP